MSDKVEQALYFPEAMLQQITARAAADDRSMSYIVQAAWTATAAQIATMDEEALRSTVRTYASSDKRKQTLFFPADMHAEIAAQAARIDASLSLLVQAAVVLAGR